MGALQKPSTANAASPAPAIFQPGEMVSERIPTKQFMRLANLKERTARDILVSCHSGHTWNDTALIVRYKGKVLQVYAPSLPKDLRDIWHERYNAANAVQKPAPVTINPRDLAFLHISS